MNSNWIRWTVASINKHFIQDIMTNNGLFTYMLEQDVDKEENRDYAEIRFDGPYITHFTHRQFRLDVNINIRIVTKLDYQDLYQRHKNVGIVAASFAEGICVYKYGDGQEDDAMQFVGTLQLCNESIIVTNFGQILTSVPAFQTTIEGHYRMYLGE